MSLWANLKNYVFGVPLPKTETPAPVVEVKKEEPAPVVKEEPKQLELKLDDVKQEVTLTVTPPSTVEVTPSVEAKPEKKKSASKKSTSKKKTN